MKNNFLNGVNRAFLIYQILIRYPQPINRLLDEFIILFVFAFLVRGKGKMQYLDLTL